MNEVVSNGTRAVAFGSDAWTSTDARHWTASGSNAMQAPVVAGPAGFMSAGGCGTDPAVCTSADGHTWESHALPLDWKPEAAAVASLGVGHGLVVAIGISSTGGGAMETSPANYRQRFEFWWSSNGSDWHLGAYTGSGLQLPGPIVVTDTGFVAYGGLGGFWRSPDGRTWSRVARSKDPGMFIDATGARQTSGVDAITFFNSHFIAASAAGVFVSNDLVTWHSLPAKAVAGKHFGLFATFGGVLYAVDQGSTEAFEPGGVWRSSDGLSWSELSLGTEGTGLLLGGLTMFHGHLIVAAMDPPSEGDPMSGPSNGSVLVSPDLLPNPAGP